jgi:hypothetical protein
MIKAFTIFLFMVALSVNAQNSFRGGMIQGVEAGDNPIMQSKPWGWWDAGYGITLTGAGKVQTWADLSGNNFVLNNYSNALNKLFPYR